MTAEEKKNQMFSLVARWRESGLTRMEFATQHDLQISSFNYWCKLQYNEVIKPKQKQPAKITTKQQDTSPSFIELVTDNKPSNQNGGRAVMVELLLPNGITLKIY